MTDCANLKRIYEIPLTEIDPFPDHPYKVRDDEDMMNLVESVCINGIITPATVFMVESNFQRTTILPSEKAFAFQMRLEAMNRQGKS